MTTLNKAEKLQAQVHKALEARAAAALSVDNTSLHDKFMTEKKMFKIEYAQVMLDNSIDAKFVNNIAIYAMQKVRKILNAVHTKSTNKLDKYTSAILSNAQTRKNAIDNKQQNASLASSIELETMKAKDVRLHKAVSTASTQSSSTRKALQALKIATYDSENKTLNFQTESAIFKALTEKKTK